MRQTIKGIDTPTFKLYLYETNHGLYVVEHEKNGILEVSDTVQDLNIALYLFDVKLVDSEGT